MNNPFAFVRRTMSFLLAPLVLALSLITGAPDMADAHETDHAGTIVISASGSVVAVPDMAMISTGVVSEAETARDALDDNTRAMVEIIRSLRDAGIKGRDIQTTNFSVQPRYGRRTRDGKPPEIDGYRVVNSVRIRVRNIKRLGDILDVVVSDGSNQIGNIQFDVSNAEELRDEARANAVEEATRKARIYAEAAGVALGNIRKIQEQGVSVAPRQAMMRSAAAEAVPIEAGETTISASVTIEWELR